MSQQHIDMKSFVMQKTEFTCISFGCTGTLVFQLDANRLENIIFNKLLLYSFEYSL